MIALLVKHGIDIYTFEKIVRSTEINEEIIIVCRLYQKKSNNSQKYSDGKKLFSQDA
jgi:hypothetical protein